MKYLVFTVLLLISPMTAAKNITEIDITYCRSVEALAEVIQTEMGKGVSKSDMYLRLSVDTDKESEEDAYWRELSYKIVDIVYRGVTPDTTFTSCIDVVRKVESQKKSKKVDKWKY